MFGGTRKYRGVTSVKQALSPARMKNIFRVAKARYPDEFAHIVNSPEFREAINMKCCKRVFKPETWGICHLEDIIAIMHLKYFSYRSFIGVWDMKWKQAFQIKVYFQSWSSYSVQHSIIWRLKKSGFSSDAAQARCWRPGSALRGIRRTWRIMQYSEYPLEWNKSVPLSACLGFIEFLVSFGRFNYNLVRNSSTNHRQNSPPRRHN